MSTSDSASDMSRPPSRSSQRSSRRGGPVIMGNVGTVWVVDAKRFIAPTDDATRLTSEKAIDAGASERSSWRQPRTWIILSVYLAIMIGFAIGWFYPAFKTCWSDRPVSGDETAAKANLDATVSRYRGNVEQDLIGRWTAQLSAKYYGLSLDDQKFTYQAIWKDFVDSRDTAVQQAYGYPVILIRGGMLSSLGRNNRWYVSVIDHGFSGEGRVETWCAEQQLVLQAKCIPVEITSPPFNQTLYFGVFGILVTLWSSIVTLMPANPRNRQKRTRRARQTMK